MEQLFKGQISEFTDWITGDNSDSGVNDTGGLPVSGASIRDLLSKRLQKPIVVNKNEDTGNYEIFASHLQQQKYLLASSEEDKVKYLLGEILGPSKYSIVVKNTNTSGEINISALDKECNLEFSWECRLGESIQAMSVDVYINIINELGLVVNTINKIYTETESSAKINILDKLATGQNKVIVSVSNNTYKIKGEITYKVSLVKLTINEDLYDNFKYLQKNADSLSLNVYTEASINDEIFISIYVDQNTQPIHTIKTTTNKTDHIVIDNFLQNLDEKLQNHRLLIVADYSKNGKHIYSNVLVKTFTLLKDESDSNIYFNYVNSFNVSNLEGFVTLPHTDLTFIAELNYPFSLDFGIATIKTFNYSVSIYYSTNEELTSVKLAKESDKLTLLGEISGASNLKRKLLYMFSFFGEGYLFYSLGGDSIKKFGKISINKSLFEGILEDPSYMFKISAFGLQNKVHNNFITKSRKGNGVPILGEAEFINIPFTDTIGWYENSLRLYGKNARVEIPVGILNVRSNFTIEVDFLVETVHDKNDVLFNFLNILKIYPNRLVLLNNSVEVIKTNFIENRRLKIQVAVFSLNYKDLNYQGITVLTTNGIQERGVIDGKSYNLNSVDNNKIIIGGANTGFRLYSLKFYDNPLSMLTRYTNWVFDLLNKGAIISRNDIFTSNLELSLDKLKPLIDIFYIEGDILSLLTSDGKVRTNVMSIKRECPYDKSLDFEVNWALIGKHGQSTLNYPVPSFKIWLNKGPKEETEDKKLKFTSGTNVYTKNRYKMRHTSIPSNKFVLLANYADSSGTHNGSLQRLINDTWYSAKINDVYVLRTPPQLFTTNQINELSGIKYGSTITEEDRIFNKILSGRNSNDADPSKDNRLYGNYVTNLSEELSAFPYPIRIAPDSIPCLVFYKQNVDGVADLKYTFLGLYVFMEDKKSDFIYGERSIYTNTKGVDPFCMLPANSKADKAVNRIWDNSKVARVEIMAINDSIVDYKEDLVPDPKTGSYIHGDVNSSRYDLVYPDPDDLVKPSKISGVPDELSEESIANYNKAMSSFVKFHNWVVSCYKDEPDKNNYLYTKFRNEAHRHIDFYKMAAYYFFCMVFGLVDSMLRNAQAKTYDGEHWWYESWDMDIALGNLNSGGIAYDPPMDLNTKLNEKEMAYSGTTDYLWSALINWPEWLNTVKLVADALYTAGLSFENVHNMFDNEYASKWSELMYNTSGEFKYIIKGRTSSGTSEYMSWLLGSRAEHRYWWLKTSMEYWFAKYLAGSYRDYSFYVATDSPAKEGRKVTIGSLNDNYYSYIYLEDVIKESHIFIKSGKTEDLLLDAKMSLSNKTPFKILNCTNITHLDFSDIAEGAKIINLNSAGRSLSLPKEGEEEQDALNGFVLPLKYLDISCNLHKEGGYDYISGKNLQMKTINGVNNAPNLETLIMAGMNFLIPNALLKLKYIDSRGNKTAYYLFENNNFEKVLLPDHKGLLLLFHNISISSLEFYSEVAEGDRIKFVPNNNLIPFSILCTGTTCALDSNHIIKNLCWKFFKNQLEKILIDDTLQTPIITLENIYWDEVSYEDLLYVKKWYNSKTPNITGIIKLKNEPITKQQLIQLLTDFGPNVFTLSKRNTCLVIDYPRTDNLIVLNHSEIVYEGLTPTLQEKDTRNIIISYTLFLLTDSYKRTYWRFINSLGNLYEGHHREHLNVSFDEEWDDDALLAIYYLKIEESKNTITLPYEIKIAAAYDLADFNNLQETNIITLKIIPVNYPKLLKISELTAGKHLGNNKYLMRDSGSSITISKEALADNEATIAEEGSHVEWKWFKKNYSEILGDSDDNCSISKTEEQIQSGGKLLTKYSLKFRVNSIATEETTYIIKCILHYKYDIKEYSYEITTSYDPAIIDTSLPSLFNLINNHLGFESTNSTIYKSDLLNISSLNISEDITTFSTLKPSEDIFKYLPNLKTLDINSSYFNQSNIESVIANCSLLESLNINKASISNVNLIENSGKKLANLNIFTSNVNCAISIFGDYKALNIQNASELTLEHINRKGSIINAPNLKVLTVKDSPGINWVNLLTNSVTKASIMLLGVTEISKQNLHKLSHESNNNLFKGSSLTIDEYSTLKIDVFDHKWYAEVNENLKKNLVYENLNSYILVYKESDATTYQILKNNNTYNNYAYIESIGLANTDLVGAAWDTSPLKLNNPSNLTGFTSKLEVKKSPVSQLLTVNLFLDILNNWISLDLSETDADIDVYKICDVIKLGNPKYVKIDGTLNSSPVNLDYLLNLENLKYLELRNVSNPFTKLSNIPESDIANYIANNSLIIDGEESIPLDASEFLEKLSKLPKTDTLKLSGKIIVLDTYLKNTAGALLKLNFPNLTFIGLLFVFLFYDTNFNSAISKIFTSKELSPDNLSDMTLKTFINRIAASEEGLQALNLLQYFPEGAMFKPTLTTTGNGSDTSYFGNILFGALKLITFPDIITVSLYSSLFHPAAPNLEYVFVFNTFNFNRYTKIPSDNAKNLKLFYTDSLNNAHTDAGTFYSNKILYSYTLSSPLLINNVDPSNIKKLTSPVTFKELSNYLQEHKDVTWDNADFETIFLELSKTS